MLLAASSRENEEEDRDKAYHAELNKVIMPNSKVYLSVIRRANVPMYTLSIFKRKSKRRQTHAVDSTCSAAKSCLVTIYLALIS